MDLKQYFKDFLLKMFYTEKVFKQFSSKMFLNNMLVFSVHMHVSMCPG